MTRLFWKKFEDRFGLLVIGLGFSLVVGLFLWHNWNLRKKSHYSEHQATLNTAYQASVHSYRLAMEGFFDHTVNTRQVLDILNGGSEAQGPERDLQRGKLYRLLYKDYEDMKRKGVWNLQFHLADGTSFLRFHQPEHYGDSLTDSSAAIRASVQQKRAVQGFENGRFRSGFVYVFPLFHERRYIGGVEVGVTGKSILDSLKLLDPKREYAFLFNRKLAEANLFAEQKWLYSPSTIHGDYLEEEANAALPDSPPPLSEMARAIGAMMGENPAVYDGMSDGRPLTVSKRLLGKTYTVSFLPMRDLLDRNAGYLVSYTLDPVIAKIRQEYLLVLGFTLFCLGLISMLILRLRLRTITLETERQNLKAMNDALAEGVYVQDAEGIIQRVNPAACEILGYAQSELVGQSSHALLHRHGNGVKLPREECPFFQHVRAGKGYDGEEIFLAKSGALLTVELASRPIFYGGSVVGSVTAFHDITRRKETEAALRQSKELERKLSMVVEQSPVSVVITNANGVIEYVNSKVLKMSGYSLEELVGQKPEIFTSGVMSEETGREIWRTILSGSEWKGEIQNRRKDGSVYWEYTTLSPVRNEQGQTTHFVAFKQDATERMRMEAELREAEMIQRTMMESLPVGLVIIDQRTRVIESVNSHAATMFGVDREAIVGNRCHNYMCPSNVDSCPIIDLGKTIDNSDRIMIRADGSEVPVIKTVKAISIQGRHKLLECFVDIRERKRTENALEEANLKLKAAIERSQRLAREAEAASSAKSEFLSNMSHEIRTPMNAVLGMTYLALQTKLTAEQRDYLVKVERSAKSLLGILNEILDLSKVEAGKLELERVDFDLHEVLDNLITVISTRVQDKNVEFIVGVAPDVPTRLVGDPMRLGQVLINLTGNAAKFTQSGEVRVDVRVERPLSEKQVALRFDVLDTGIGIDPARLEDLFNPFTQADVSMTRQFGGTGLGLSISRRLILLMGGDIRVESTLGKGSLFSFNAVFAPSRGGSRGRSLSRQMLRKRVLVVDDRISARGVLTGYLRHLGMRPEEAASGFDALSTLRQACGTSPYDLVFIDWKMPGMDGIETFRAISEDSGIDPKPKGVLLSAFGRHEVPERAHREGFSAFLLKPVSLNTLVDVMNKCGADSVPVPDFCDQPGAGAPPADGGVCFPGGRVLLVEDNETNQQVAKAILGIAGLDVVVAVNGVEAVEKATSERFDAILMDIQMPKMDGLEATRRIRQHPGCESLPIIAMTAYATHEERDRVLAAGMDDHVAKPIDIKTLFESLGRFIPIDVPPPKPLPAREKTRAPQVHDMMEGLERLIPYLRACKPRQCLAVMKVLRDLPWPRDRGEDLKRIDGWIGNYQFSEALELAESIYSDIRKLGGRS